MITKARNASYAVYKGKEYLAERDYEQNKIYLLSTDSKELQNGFLAITQHDFEKEVTVSELDSAYTVFTYAYFGGFKFNLEEIENEKGLLVHTGSHPHLHQLGFEMVEPHVFEKWVPLEELENIFEEKTPIWGFTLPND